MSDLRKQLRELQNDYTSMKYPGDLAADVLGKQSQAAGGGWMKLAVGLAAAVALAGMVWVGLDRSQPVEVATHPPIETPPQVEETDDTIITVPTLAAAKPSEAVERPTWASIHEDDSDARPSFSSIGGLSMPYQSLTMPSQSEVQQIRDEQQQQTVEGT